MYIPIEILIEAERKRKELEAEEARPRLQLELPPPEYIPEIDHEELDDRGYVDEDASPNKKSDRGVIIIEM